jgi:hypothetical protein
MTEGSVQCIRHLLIVFDTTLQQFASTVKVIDWFGNLALAFRALHTSNNSQDHNNLGVQVILRALTPPGL